MEVFKGDSLFRVDSLRQRNCDQCSRSHLMCDKKKPMCSRCSKSQKACTYDKPVGYRTQIHKVREVGFGVPSKPTSISKGVAFLVVPLDWKSVFMNSHSDILIRVFLRLYAAPLLPGNPSARQAQGVLSIISRFDFGTKPVPDIPKPICFSNQLDDLAIDAFFRYYNPHLPLFSRKYFHIHPRSEHLRRVVIRTGLQCLENSSEKFSLLKIFDGKLEAVNIFQLPYNLDSLQYLSLLCFGVSSFIHRKMHSIIARIAALVTFLGLHLDLPSHPQRSERRLAFQGASLCIYHMGTNSVYFHMPSSFIDIQSLRKTNPQPLDSFKRSQDLSTQDAQVHIHLVTSKCVLLFTILLTEISRNFILVMGSNENGHKLIKAIEDTEKKLQHFFLWGWKSISQLNVPDSESTSLKSRSRVVLALNYHITRIKLMKVASHISSDPNSALFSFESTDSITSANIRGLASSLTLIHLLNQFPPVPGGIGFRQLMQPSSFIISHLGAIKKTFSKSTQAHFLSTLEMAKSISTTFFKFQAPQSTTENLELLKETLEFCRKR